MFFSHFACQLVAEWGMVQPAQFTSAFFACEAQGQNQESQSGIRQKLNQMVNAEDESSPREYMANKSQRNGLELEIGN